jgi:uncharacterized YigZ family protein
MEVLRTVKGSVRVRIPIGNCRFFSSVRECSSEEEARAFIREVSDVFQDATHNAWGFRIGIGETTVEKCSDDREPAHTAGPPILQAIEGAGVTNCVVVVTRYFGGVKLGVGGLIRAYRQSAAAGLAEAGVREVEIRQGVILKRLNYSILGSVMHELESIRAEVVAVDYTEEISISARIFPATLDALRVRITDLTRGQGVLEHE